jgi:hypothetical protein
VCTASFSDPHIGLTIVQKLDRVTPKLPALLEYQLSLATPSPPPGSFNAAAAFVATGDGFRTKRVSGTTLQPLGLPFAPSAYARAVCTAGFRGMR